MRWLIQCPKTFTIAIGSICMVYLPTFTIKNPPFMWVNTPVIWILWDCHSRFLKVQKPPKPLSIQFVVPISGLARALLRLRFGDLRSVSHMQRITWGIFRKWLARLRQKLWDEKSFNHWNSTESETEHNHLYRHLLSSNQKKTPAFFNQCNIHVNNKNPPHWPRKGSEAPQLFAEQKNEPRRKLHL